MFLIFLVSNVLDNYYLFSLSSVPMAINIRDMKLIYYKFWNLGIVIGELAKGKEFKGNTQAGKCYR